MATTPSPDNLFLGKGEIYLDRHDANGLPTGQVHLGNCESLSISFEDDVIESFNHMDSAAGLYKRVTKLRKPILKIIGEEFTSHILGIMNRGTVGTLTQNAAAEIVDELATAAPVHGRWYTLSKRNVSGVSVKQGVTTMDIDDDYLVDLVRGRIYVVPGGAIDPAEDLEVTFTPGSVSKTMIAGGVSLEMVGSLLFVGDPTAGPAQEVEVWKADLAPDGELGLITDDFGKWSLVATVLSDSVNHPSEPFYRKIFL